MELGNCFFLEKCIFIIKNVNFFFVVCVFVFFIVFGIIFYFLFFLNRCIVLYFLVGVE